MSKAPAHHHYAGTIDRLPSNSSKRSSQISESSQLEPEANYHYSGVIDLVPSSSSKRSSSQFCESTQMEKKVRTSYKDEYGGGWSKVTESYKAQEYVDEKTGGMGYKQEAKYTSTDKYVDKEQGYTTEYQTQVKIQKSVYPNKSSTSKSKINKNRIDQLLLIRSLLFVF